MKLDLKEKIDLNLPDSSIFYYPSFFSLEEATNYFSVLRKETSWQQDDITLFGKTYPQPRLTALYANNEIKYKYSNITMHPSLFTTTLLEIKCKIERLVQQEFTSCLLNLYRDGKDSNGWHADDEKELGENPIIASLSLGADRIFQLKHKVDKNLKQNIVLESGSLLIMKGETQYFWKHQIPKTKKIIEERINLTFRVIT